MLSSLNKQKIAAFLSDPGTYATVLLAILLDNYTTEALNWDPETLEKELEEDFGIKLPSINRDKLNAIITLLTTDLAYNDWFVFNSIIEAFNNDPVDLDTIDPVTPDQMAWGVTEMLLNEDSKDRPQFSDDVKRYMGLLLYNNGVHKPVDVLSMAIMPDDKNKPDDILSTDPDMYLGYMNKQNSDNDYIKQYIKDNTMALLDQLNTVPLQNRNTDDWKQFHSNVIKALK